VGNDPGTGRVTSTVSPGTLAELIARDEAQLVALRRESDEPIPVERPPTITYSYRRGGVVRGVDLRFCDPAVVSPIWPPSK